MATSYGFIDVLHLYTCGIKDVFIYSLKSVFYFYFFKGKENFNFPTD